MNSDSFDGSIIMELLAEHGLVDDFYEAIDDDNLAKAVSLMRRAQIDEETISTVIEHIQDLN